MGLSSKQPKTSNSKMQGKKKPVNKEAMILKQLEEELLEHNEFFDMVSMQCNIDVLRCLCIVPAKLNDPSLSAC